MMMGPSRALLIPVTVPITVCHPQEDQQEDQEEEDGAEDPVDHGGGDGDADITQAPHPPGLGRDWQLSLTETSPVLLYCQAHSASLLVCSLVLVPLIPGSPTHL